MNNNSNSNKNNLIMKNENLRNMMNKISEDAHRQLNESAKSNHEDLLESLFDDPKKHEKNMNSLEFEDEGKKIQNLIFPLNGNKENFDEFQNFDYTPNINIKTREKEMPKNNENFTQEFFMERYKNFIPSNIVTPTDFNKNMDMILNHKFGNNMNNIFEHRRSVPDFNNNEKGQNLKRNSLSSLDLIHTKLNSNLIQSVIESHNLYSWIKIYNEINQNKKITLERYIENLDNFNFLTENSLFLKLDSFFKKFDLKTKTEMIICEIKKINVIDCLHILEVRDFSGENKKIMITSNEYTKDSKQKFRSENPISNSSSLIRDDQFKQGDVILINKNGVKDMSINGGKPILVVPFKNIKQIKN